MYIWILFYYAIGLGYIIATRRINHDFFIVQVKAKKGYLNVDVMFIWPLALIVYAAGWIKGWCQGVKEVYKKHFKKF